MSHRSIAPSPLSSVRFATSGETMLLVSPFGPFHIHWISGSKLFGGAAFVQFGTPLVSSWTLHLLTYASGPPLPLPPPSAISRWGVPHAANPIHTIVPVSYTHL